MSRVITFSRTFPSYHPKAGQPTYFVEKVARSIWNLNLFNDDHLEQFPQFPSHVATGNAAKHHTIRAGHRWKAGDWFSPRVWSGKPYRSKQIQFAPDIEIKKVWNFDIDENGICSLNHKYILEYEDGSMDNLEKLIAENDGLTDIDFFHWLIYPVYKTAKPFDGQILCWNENINY